LDQAVRVLSAREVSEDFHPRFSARSRVYRYTIDNAPIINPLSRRIAGHVLQKLDVAAMRQAAPVFIGRQDFKAWESAGSPAGSTQRTVKRLVVQRRRAVFGSGLIEIEIEADAFLYQMVRNIVGALIRVGEGKLTADGIRQLTAGLDRTQCPPPAPPQGLSLVQVKY